MSVFPFIVVVFAPVVMIIIIGQLSSTGRRQSAIGRPRWKALEGSLIALGAKPGSRRSWVLDRAGISWQIRLITGEGADHLCIHRALPISAAPDAAARHPGVGLVWEGRLHRIFKRLAPVRELQVGNPRFDDHIYVSSVSARPAARAWLQKPAVEQGIMTLFDGSCSQLGVGIRQIPWWSPVPFGASFAMDPAWAEPAGLASTFDALAAVSNGLPPAKAAPPSPTARVGLTHLVLLGCILAAFSIQISVTHAWYPLVKGLWVSAIPIFIGLNVLTLGLAIGLVRLGRVGLHGLCATLCYGWVAHGCLSGAVVVVLNGHGDPSIDQYETTVVGHRTVKTDSGITYRVDLAPVAVSPEPLSKSVSKAEHARAQVGDRCVLIAGSGKLGIPWRESLSCTFSEAVDP